MKFPEPETKIRFFRSDPDIKIFEFSRIGQSFRMVFEGCGIAPFLLEINGETYYRETSQILHPGISDGGENKVAGVYKK